MCFANRSINVAILAVIAAIFLIPISAGAHCDRVNGPVASAARTALETGNFDKIVIWVGQEQEKELKQAYEQSLPVYNTGDTDAKKLAERYFMEAAVRLHRAAEGFPYSGLKPEQPLPPDIKAAEKALDTGNLKPVNELLTRELTNKTGKWFQNALEARKNKDKSVAAGREWVDAYVKYVIYVHGLHQTIQEGPAHGVGEK